MGGDTASAWLLRKSELVQYCSPHLARLQSTLVRGLRDAVLIVGALDCESWPIIVVVDLLMLHLPQMPM